MIKLFKPKTKAQLELILIRNKAEYSQLIEIVNNLGRVSQWHIETLSKLNGEIEVLKERIKRLG